MSRSSAASSAVPTSSSTSVLRDAGDLDAALVELEAAVKQDGTHARAAYERAHTLNDLGQYASAEKAFENFVFAFPADPFIDEARRALEELRER